MERVWIGAATVAAVVALAACSSAPRPACQCPKPVAYSDAMIKKITAALKALPPDSVLQQAMSDYENERYVLRACAR